MDLAEASKGAGQAVQGSVSGNMQGRMVGYYDYEHSVWVSVEGSITTTTDITPEGEAAAAGAMTIKTTMRITMALVTKPAGKVTEKAGQGTEPAAK